MSALEWNCDEICSKSYIFMFQITVSNVAFSMKKATFKRTYTNVAVNTTKLQIIPQRSKLVR